MSSEDGLLRAQLLSLELRFQDAVRTASLQTVIEPCVSTFAQAQEALNRGSLAPETAALAYRIASCVKVIAANLGKLEQVCENEQQALDDQSTDDPTTSSPYRQWFLDHLSNPYPTSKDKDALLKQVTVHTRRQLDTWYTNQRRRSGWHALKRKYGHISALLKRIDEADEDDEEMRQARKEVERVRAYFKNDRQDHVRDEIREIISQGPPTTSTKRRIESGPARRAVGTTARPRSHFPGNPPSTPAPLMPGSWAPYPVIHDDDYSAPMPSTRLQLAPRLPSDFSSPDSSRRTFSGSSSSSTDSLISYDSLDIPVSTPGPASPPASSSLLNFDGRSTFVPSSPARAPRHSPRRGSFVVRNSVYPTRPHPYFCTVNELPTGSSLARFASS